MDPVQLLKNIETLLKAASQSGDIATIERFVVIAEEFIAGVRADRPLPQANLQAASGGARRA